MIAGLISENLLLDKYYKNLLKKPTKAKLYKNLVKEGRQLSVLQTMFSFTRLVIIIIILFYFLRNNSLLAKRKNTM